MPTASVDLTFELPGSPTGIAGISTELGLVADQRFQDLATGGEIHVRQNPVGTLDPIGGASQEQHLPVPHWTTDPDRFPTLPQRLQTGDHVVQLHLGGSVEDQSQRPILIVIDHEYDRPVEVGIAQASTGHQEAAYVEGIGIRLGLSG